MALCPPPFRQQLYHVCGDANGFGGIDEGTLDRLLDPVAGIGAEASVHGRIEALDRTQKPQISFLDEVLETQTLAGIAAGDVHHEPKIGTHHAVARLVIAHLDLVSQFLLFIRAKSAVSLISRR